MFLQETQYLPERKKSSCKKLYQFLVQNATILKNFTAMAKTNLVTKNINAVNVSTNSLRIVPLQGLADPFRRMMRENIPLALVAAKLHFFITITIFMLIIAAVIRNVITHCLYPNQLPYQLHQCLSCLEKLILSVCVTLFISF